MRLALAQRVVEIVSHVRGLVTLKQLGIRPLHAAVASAALGGRPGAAESLQQEHAVRELARARARRCTARPRAAPCSPRRSESRRRRGGTRRAARRPARPTARDAPDRARPGPPTWCPTRRDCGTRRSASRWNHSGMLVEQRGAPARVVEHDVEDHQAIAQVHGVGQLAELIAPRWCACRTRPAPDRCRSDRAARRDCRSGPCARRWWARDPPAADAGCGSRACRRCAAVRGSGCAACPRAESRSSRAGRAARRPVERPAASEASSPRRAPIVRGNAQ